MKNLIVLFYSFLVCSTVLAQDMSHVDIVRYQDGRYGILPADAGCYEGSSEIIRGLGLSDELRDIINDVEPEAIVNTIQDGQNSYVIYDNQDHSNSKLFYKTSLEKHLVLRFNSSTKYMEVINIKNIYVPKFVFGWTQIFALVCYIGVFVVAWFAIRDEKRWWRGASILGIVIFFFAFMLSFFPDGTNLTNPLNLFWIVLIIHLGLCLYEPIRRRKDSLKMDEFLGH